MTKFENDLTSGSVGRQLIKFSLPFLLSNFIQALYNVADMLIVSWFSGPHSVAGVSNAGHVTMIVTNFVVGLTVGGAVLVGQYYGAGQREEMKKTIGTMLTILVVLAVALTVIMIIACEPILRLIQVPAESIAEAKDYFNICMVGTIFIFGYNAVSAILRGMGDSKRPLIFVTIAAVINVGLDLLLVGPVHMGAAGAAIATVVSQAISLVLSIIYLMRNKFVFDFKLSSFKIDWQNAGLIAKIGFPNSIQNVIVGISFLFMMVIVNGYGMNASAAMGIVGKFNGFAILPAIAMSASVSSMCAQNIGAGLYDRAKKTMFTGMAIVFPLGVAFCLLAFIAPRAILGMFTDSQAVIDEGVKYIRFFSIDYICVPFTFCINGLMTGAGHTTFTMFSSMLSSVLLRVPIALLFGVVFAWGLTGIGLAAPVATLGSMAVGIIYYRSGKWMTKRI